MWKQLAGSLAAAVALAFGATAARAEGLPGAERDAQIIKNARADRSVGQVLVFYVPNRVFDLLDILRLRVRVGPGIAARVRATEGLDVGLGSYSSLFVGIPGPRQHVELPLPLGLESYTGIEVGPGDAELEGGASPNYASTEFGASLHALVTGFDLGVDPLEVVDLAAGLVLLDFRADDY
jgi:hypothetical protein